MPSIILRYSVSRFALEISLSLFTLAMVDYFRYHSNLELLYTVSSFPSYYIALYINQTVKRPMQVLIYQKLR